MSFYGREWVCGLYFFERPHYQKYLPRTSLSVHSQIIGSTSRSVLTQKFVNPQDKAIPELRYTFPLYDGVSVVGFVCTVNNDRVIRGTVKERAEARKTFKEAVARGETAGLLEQLPEASDVFTTTIGNIPAGAEIKVELTYLGELKHDAESDGIRFTIPTKIAPRYGSHHSEVLTTNFATSQSGIEIVVDAEMPQGSNIKAVQSPSHPILVTIGNTSLSADAEMSLQKASATLSLGTAELDKDFVVHVVATNSSNPVAVLETHPTIPNQRALMATLVPKFNLPPARPEIVFICDRSGSMGNKITNLKAALRLFLKSLPLGVKFNICSFGSHHEFLFKNGSVSYDAASLEKAERYVSTFAANFGGTEMYQPVEAAFQKRYKDMNLEVILLTDGEIWDQDRLFRMINTHVSESSGDIRLFTLGIGNSVSHALIEGVARAGNGFTQTVGDNEKMNTKLLRMLKASLSPHVTDYTLEIKYGKEDRGHREPPSTLDNNEDDDFEIVERVMDSLSIEVAGDPQNAPAAAPANKQPISLFDPSADADVDMVDASLDQSASGKYSHVPPVAEPKILQAPFDIPPLYPFNRTTVCLLLSPQSPQRAIKSVVLRGTSAHGPLELEIPVTALAQKGETIHQLAARKAVKELEEGRGWIYHAKDVKEPEKLLKDKYEGRFSDMVEREAVRLGVTFQVGGKWCSFVAVEENNSTKEKEEEVIQQSIEEESIVSNVSPAQSAFGASGPITTAFGQTPAPPPFVQAQKMSGGLFGGSSAMGGGALFGASTSAASTGFGQGAFGSPGMASPAAATSLFGARAPAPSPPAPGMASAWASFGRQPQVQQQQMQQMQRQAQPQVQQLAQQQAQAQATAHMRQSQVRTRTAHALQAMSASSRAPPEFENYLAAYDFDLQFAAPLPDEGNDTTTATATALDDFDFDSFLATEENSREEASEYDDLSEDEGDSGPSGVARFMVDQSADEEVEEDDDSDDDMGYALFDSGSPPAPMMARRRGPARDGADRDSGNDNRARTRGFQPVDTRDTFEKLVLLQSFAGSWAWTGEVLGLLELKETDARLVGLMQSQSLSPGDVLATALVLTFLENKLADRKDEWELLADKARDWLSDTAGVDVEAFVARLGGLF